MGFYRMSTIDNLEQIKFFFKGILPNQIEIKIYKENTKIVCTTITGNVDVIFNDDGDRSGHTRISFVQNNSISFEICIRGIEIISYDELTKDISFEFDFFIDDEHFGRICVKGEPDDNHIDFDKLVRFAKRCTACKAMSDKEAIIGYQNGNVNADILFVAEAPGPQGADKTGIPLTGDRTGNNFEEILRAASLKRRDIFITNAVLCCPTNQKGKVRPPEPDEIENCNVYLELLIELIDPKVVVPIGVVALKALNQIKEHQLKFKNHIATFHPWNGRLIYPLYHPSPLVINRGLRTMEQQKADYIKLIRDYEKYHCKV